jgi:hypothetical protein
MIDPEAPGDDSQLFSIADLLACNRRGAGVTKGCSTPAPNLPPLNRALAVIGQALNKPLSHDKQAVGFLINVE